MPRHSRDNLPTDRVQWKNEKDLFLDVKSTYRAGDSIVLPVTVKNMRRINAMRARYAEKDEGVRVRAVTDLNKDNFYVWVEDRPGQRRRK